ncbi:MAG TPA: hypothetical protein VK483_01385 [Chitinophagaceae bacterium]|nr:hypothetical protein [Chitinophagaceae bacterium]
MSTICLQVFALDISKVRKVILVSWIVCLNFCFGISAAGQTISKSDLSEFKSNLKWELKTNSNTSALGFGVMQNTLIRMSKSPTPIEVLAALETVTDDTNLFDKFLYECVMSQKNNKDVSEQVLYKFCRSYSLAIKLYDYVQIKYGKLLIKELKEIRENEEKERIEKEKKQKLEGEKEKARIEIEQKKEEEENRVFDTVDVEASFPGGDSALKNYINSAFRGQVATDNGAPTGNYIITVQFIVDKLGGTTGFNAISSNGYGLEEELIRTIRKSSKWIPALLNGKKVKSFQRQVFTLSIQ